jgi:hypothetical protein
MGIAQNNRRLAMDLKEAMMRKATLKNGFGGGLVAASLAFTLAAFGCSSNQMYGNGQPTTVTPTINSSDHAVTPGSSSGTEGNPPMASSYTYPSSASSMYPTNEVDVDAQANLAAQRAYRGVVLGPADPGGVQPVPTVAGGVYVSPALTTNPAATINSSISSSGGGQAITGGPIIPAPLGGVTLANSGAPTVATNSLGTTATTGALTTATTGALTTATGTPALAGSAAFSPVLMNSTPAPQATGTANPTLATIGATGTTAAPIVGGSLLPGATPATAATTGMTRTAATSGLRTTGSATMNIAGGIQIQSGANGGVMVTNVGTGAAAGAAAHH